jgi:hypothetical protein
MTLAQLDFIFPFFMFFYGILVTFVLENKALQRIAADRHFAPYQGLVAHRGLAFVCVIVGGLWSLQNLWF